MSWVNMQHRAPDPRILRSEALLLSKRELYGEFHSNKNKRNSFSLHLFIQIHTCCFGRRNMLLLGRLGTRAAWLYRNFFTQCWMLSVSWNIFKNTKPNRQQLDSLMRFETDMRLYVVQTNIIRILRPNLACKGLDITQTNVGVRFLKMQIYVRNLRCLWSFLPLHKNSAFNRSS